MNSSPLRAPARLFRFALGVVRHFRASNGLLLAGAVAYNALLSLVPFFLLLLVALSHLIDQRRLLATIAQDLRFIVPGQTEAVMTEIEAFLANRSVIGGVGLAALIFFSGMAFSVLESAMAAIFHRRPKSNRSFIVSTMLPYLFVLTLGGATLVLTLLSALFAPIGDYSVALFGHAIPLARVGAGAIYIVDVAGIVLTTTAVYLVMPVGRMKVRHALIGGITTTALWELVRRFLAWYFVHISSVNVIYGSIATTIITLLSFEVGAIILLLGAQVIAEIERPD